MLIHQIFSSGVGDEGNLSTDTDVEKQRNILGKFGKLLTFRWNGPKKNTMNLPQQTSSCLKNEN